MLPALLFFFASLVNDVRDLIARHDLAAAERAARSYQSQKGATSELAAAVSWIARGALAAKDWKQAERFSMEASDLSLGCYGPASSMRTLGSRLLWEPPSKCARKPWRRAASAPKRFGSCRNNSQPTGRPRSTSGSARTSIC